jgi:chloramphenicol O-acetyltransferase type B
MDILKLTKACPAMFRGVLNPLVRYFARARRYGINRVRFPNSSIDLYADVIDVELEDAVSVGPKCTIVNSRIGRYSYFASDVQINQATIGRFCSVGPGVRIGLWRHDVHTCVSSHPLFFSTNRQACGEVWLTKREQLFDESLPVTIGSDVWIGANAVIAGGIEIGDGAVIGAGAVVVRSVAPYEIVGGVPAKRIRMRFPDKDIDLLVKSCWWDWDVDLLRANVEEMASMERFRQKVGNLNELRAEDGSQAE